MDYTETMALKDTIFHRWLKIPYTLHIEINRMPATKKAPTILFIHGIGNSGAAWQEIIGQLPDHFRLITIDLLGFGKSPRPAWATYNAKTQARSVIATLLKLRINGPVIIVGHSLGALVAVEVTKRYPLIVRSLILCSPPFYAVDEVTRRLFPSGDSMLRKMYRHGIDHPETLIKIAALAIRLGIVNKTFTLTANDVPSYMGALEASIINQTSLEDATQLKKPVTIIAGRFDPVVIKRNLKTLAMRNKRVKLITVTAGHEVTHRFIPPIIRAINSSVAEPKRKIRLQRRA